MMIYFSRIRSSMMRSRSGLMDMCVISTAVKIRTRKDTWADGPWGTLTIITVRSWRSPVLVWWCVHETALSQTGPNFSWDRPYVTKRGRNSRVYVHELLFPKNKQHLPNELIVSGTNLIRKNRQNRLVVARSLKYLWNIWTAIYRILIKNFIFFKIFVIWFYGNRLTSVTQKYYLMALGCKLFKEHVFSSLV